MAHQAGSREKTYLRYIGRHKNIVSKIRGDAADPKSKFNRKDDELKVAQFIDKHIKTIKNQKITMVKIKKHMRENYKDLTHIERLRANHQLDYFALIKMKSSNNIVKKIKPYVNMIDSIATLTNSDADDLLFAAFLSTEYFTQQNSQHNDYVHTIVFLLEELTKAVISAENMEMYFDTFYKEGMDYDVVSEKFVRHQNDYSTFWSIGYGTPFDEEVLEDYAFDVDISLRGDPLPTAPLFRVHRATFVGPLNVEVEPIAPSDWPLKEVASICNPLIDPPESGRPFSSSQIIDAEISIYTEISLAVAPLLGTCINIRPIFRTRSYIELKLDGANRPLTFNFSTFPLTHCGDKTGELVDYFGSVAALLDDGWRRIHGFGGKGWTLKAGRYRMNNIDNINPSSPTGPAERDPRRFGRTLDAGIGFETILGESGAEWATFWRCVDPRSVERLINFLAPYQAVDSVAEIQEKARIVWLCSEKGPHELPKTFTYGGDAWKTFQSALVSGSIEEELLADCRRMKRRLEDCMREANSLLEEQIDKLLDRWKNLK